MASSAMPTAPDSTVRQYQVLPFGDLSSSGFEEEPQSLLHVKTNPLLTPFFTRVALRLRRLIGGLSYQQQDLFPHFTTLIDLLSRLEETKGTPILRFFALNVYEIALFIVEHEGGTRPYPSPCNTYVVGPCTGGFAAAAVSCSQALPDLVPLAVEAALAAFRTALCSWLAGQNITSSPLREDAVESWSAAVSPKEKNGTVEEILKLLESSEVVRSDTKLYISVTTPSQAATISGPPSVLQKFLIEKSDRLRAWDLDIRSPFHTSVIFDETDVDNIVDRIPDDDVATSRPPRLLLLSPSTGEIIVAPTFKALLREMVRETLQKPVRWDLVASKCGSLLAEVQASKCTILPFCQQRWANAQHCLDCPRHNLPYQHFARFRARGTTYRFPDADSNEAFWVLLRAGRDVHRNCNAFDDGASGYCRADAVGTVILKRLEDAEADNDPIFGVIVGTATNHCGQTDSITRPHEGDQASVFKRIMRYAGVDPLDISYIQMHGTGTQAGDATEMNSVLSVFVPNKKRTGSTTQRPLYLGSAKASIGHAESASGVSSLIKVLMMMKQNEIPPHCGIKTRINHNYPLDLAERGVRIAFNPTPWRREDSVSGKRAAFLNNFSAAGGNTAVLLEDAPSQSSVEPVVVDPRPVHVVAVTAKTSKSLVGNLDALLSWLEANPHTSLPALSYTTTARRMHHNHLTMIAAKPIPSAGKTANVVFAFTGQGTLYSGMGKELFAYNASFRADMLRFNRLATDQGFPSFLGLVDGSQAVDSANDLDVVASQLALTCVQMALVRRWRSLGITPSAVVGHSLGEYAAFYTAGVITAADAIYLVGQRAALLQEYCVPGTHAMLAVKTTIEILNELIREGGSRCEFACANQPAGHVISGRLEDVSEVEKRVTAMELKSVRLDLPFAFHSAQVEAILAPFEAAASHSVVYHAPTVPVPSPLLSRVVQEGESGVLDASYLVRACRGKVDFAGLLEAAKEDNLVNDRTIWPEIGVHPACGDMIKGTLGSDCITLASLRKNADCYKTLAAALESLYLAGLGIEWNEYHRDFPAALNVVQLPRYSCDLKKYWIQYRNDFCLTKGEGMVQAIDAATATHTPAAAVAPQHKCLSPSVQRVLEEIHGVDQSSLLVESDIFDDRLLPVLHGHVVHGAHLAPSSLYADVALTIAQYMLQGPGLSPLTTGIDVADVKVDAPLIAQPTESTHLFRVSATADWSTSSISMSIFSVDSNGKRTKTHARLEAHVFPEQRWLDEWRRNTHLILSRIEALIQGIHSGDSHKLKRGMVYKLFGAVVEYSRDYQGMKEVVLDSGQLEAVSTVKFQVDDGGFAVNPRWIDSLGGIAGFIMNGNDAVESDKQVFINHGWERLRISEKLDPAKTYSAYNRMQLVEKTLYAGDTYILHEGRTVAIFQGVKFQGVPRHVLDHVLPPRKAIPKASATNPTTRAIDPPEVQPRAPPVFLENPRKARSTEPSWQPSKKQHTSLLGFFDRVLSIICQELGVSPTELKPESEFADFGLDSLLSLTITARVREELQKDLPSSLFIEYPTIASLQALLDDQAAHSGSDGMPTPPSRSRSVSSGTSDATHITAPTPLEDGVANGGSDNRKATLLFLEQTIAEETGVPISELAPSICLADIGVDSLLALTITAKLRDALGDAIPTTLFTENGTLREVEEELASVLGLEAQCDTQPPLLSRPGAALHGNVDMNSISSPPHATSVLLWGNMRTATALLFLLPDGSGSATSYVALGPTVVGNVAVYGLNCPWRKTAEEMSRLNVDMTILAAKYVAEIQRLLVQQKQQASSDRRNIPFAIGGWSAGGIIAVEAARQLRGVGQCVDKLILLDSPNPIGLQNPPQRMYDFFDSIGIFGGGRNKMPDWLRAHFSAFIRILDDYEPTPLPDAPPTLIVYARDGVCKDPHGPRPEMRPDDPREMLWLLNNRTDFSAGGWASLLGRDRLTIRVLDDVNHFSLMDTSPVMKRLGQVVGEFLV
ncbi:hypothetical protein MFIFM68171_07898 [Madurella fahalii]|uniref:Polyketide synthase n=1 Tax=Madurella fahalii TaxID=1157608 RepID=A0ABQ0GIV8_9PEZI